MVSSGGIGCVYVLRINGKYHSCFGLEGHQVDGKRVIAKVELGEPDFSDAMLGGFESGKIYKFVQRCNSGRVKNIQAGLEKACRESRLPAQDKPVSVYDLI